jgi:hypothetical protein
MKIVDHTDVGSNLTYDEFHADDRHTFFSGTSFPGTPSDGDLYLRTDLDVLYIYSNDNTRWEPLSGLKEIWISRTEPDTAIGQFQGEGMPDGIETVIAEVINIPPEFLTLVSAEVIVLQSADAGSGNMVWTVATDHAAVGETYTTHQDTAGGTTSITQNTLISLDVSASLTNIAANDLVGFEFTRDGDNGSDTLGATCLFIGIRVRYV